MNVKQSIGVLVIAQMNGGFISSVPFGCCVVEYQIILSVFVAPYREQNAASGWSLYVFQCDGAGIVIGGQRNTQGSAADGGRSAVAGYKLFPGSGADGTETVSRIIARLVRIHVFEDVVGRTFVRRNILGRLSGSPGAVHLRGASREKAKKKSALGRVVYVSAEDDRIHHIIKLCGIEGIGDKS